MRFEVTVPAEREGEPNHLVEVDAPNWMGALKESMKRLSRPAPQLSKLVCEVRHDGVIAVRDHARGTRVFIKSIKAPHASHADPPTVSAPPGRYGGTIGYLQAQVEAKLGLAGQAAESQNPSLPGNQSQRTGAHPCLVLPRWEIDRRLAERLAEATSEQQSKPAEAPRCPTRAPQTATGDDFETTGQLPDEFQWLSTPLSVVLDSTTVLSEALDRALRLLLAACPSRVAGVALRLNSSHGPLTLCNAIGIPVGMNSGRSPGTPGGLFCACVEHHLTLVVDRQTEPFTTSHLVSDLGFEPPNATVAAIGNLDRSHGVIFVADSLSPAGYRSEDLLVSGHFGRTLGHYLEKSGATAKMPR